MEVGDLVSEESGRGYRDAPVLNKGSDERLGVQGANCVIGRQRRTDGQSNL